MLRLNLHRLHYGWILAAVLGVTEMVSYGILSYSFPVFLAPMEADLGWSRTTLTGAFSLGWLVAGAAAIPAGRWVDRHGARLLMTSGSVLAALLLLLWAGVDRVWAFYALWIGMGTASAAVLYEPAFTVLAQWFGRRTGGPLTLLTVLGGFASIVFVPLSTALVEALGWRRALTWLSGTLLVLTALPHGLLLRQPTSPPEAGCQGGEGQEEPDPREGPETRAGPAGMEGRSGTRSFRLLTATFTLATLVGAGVAVHLIPLLLDRGMTPSAAGGALGALGLAALPGRLVLTPLGERWSRSRVTAAVFGLQALALGVLALGGSGEWSVGSFVVLFGAGFGAITPARAALLADHHGPEGYGGLSGVMAAFLAGARAAAPVGLSLLHVALGGYGGVLAVLAGLSVAAGGLVLLADRDEAPRITRGGRAGTALDPSREAT